MMHGLALYLLLAGPLAESRDWWHLPDEKVCAENYHAGQRYAMTMYELLLSGESDLPPTFMLEFREAEKLRDYWLAAWWVRWPTATMEQRRLHFANMRAFEWELREHLPHGQTPPAVPVWRWERR